MVQNTFMQIEDTLPNKCSELLRVALKDLRAVEKLPDVEVNMTNWWALAGDVCYVCLAGSVMMQSFGLDIPTVKNLAIGRQARNCWGGSGTSLGPGRFPEAVQYKFYALNALRKGQISRAYEFLAKAAGKIRNLPPGVPDKVDIAQYNVNREKFCADLEQLAERLEAAGD